MADPRLSPEPLLQRRPEALVFRRGEELTVLGARGGHRFSGDTAQLAQALLLELRAPRTASAMLAFVAERTGETEARCEPIVRPLLELLAQAGALGPPREAARPAPARLGKRVALALTGAVGSAFAPELCQRLLAAGCEVQVLLTASAQRFVSWRALEALTHRPALRSLWQGRGSEPAPHIAVARWAELVLVYPASAQTIARLAAGEAEDLVSAVALATRAPVLVAPSMNDAMFDAPAVQRNLTTLVQDGRIVLEPTMGQEVADAPGARTPQWGPAPAPDRLLEVLRALFSEASPVSSPAPAAPSPPAAGVRLEDWEAQYATAPEESLPWSHRALDDDLAALLAQHAPQGGAALDLGCGTGVDALALRRWGFEVTGVDGAPTALARARAREGAEAVRWVCEPFERWGALGSFALVLDRAFLHTLPPAKRSAWAELVRALVAPGGVLLLKAHHPSEKRGFGTHPLAHEEVGALLGGDFTLLEARSSTVPGPVDPLPKAELSAWRRKNA